MRSGQAHIKGKLDTLWRQILQTGHAKTTNKTNCRNKKKESIPRIQRKYCNLKLLLIKKKMVTLGEKAKVKFIAVNFLFVFALEIKERKHEWIERQRKK